jgi:hypothetical protein
MLLLPFMAMGLSSGPFGFSNKLLFSGLFDILASEWVGWKNFFFLKLDKKLYEAGKVEECQNKMYTIWQAFMEHSVVFSHSLSCSLSLSLCAFNYFCNGRLDGSHCRHVCQPHICWVILYKQREHAWLYDAVIYVAHIDLWAAMV